MLMSNLEIDEKIRIVIQFEKQILKYKEELEKVIKKVEKTKKVCV